MIPLDWKRYQLSQLINKALSLAKPIPFDFLVRGSILRTTIGECRAENGITEVRVASESSMNHLCDNLLMGRIGRNTRSRVF